MIDLLMTNAYMKAVCNLISDIDDFLPLPSDARLHNAVQPKKKIIYQQPPVQIKSTQSRIIHIYNQGSWGLKKIKDTKQKKYLV